MIRKKDHNTVLSEIMIDLDREQAEYQRTYKKLYGTTDPKAKHIFSLLTGMCEEIRKEIDK